MPPPRSSRRRPADAIFLRVRKRRPKTASFTEQQQRRGAGLLEFRRRHDDERRGSTYRDDDPNGADGCRHNLFARLTPETAARLHRVAVQLSASSSGRRHSDDDDDDHSSTGREEDTVGDEDGCWRASGSRRSTTACASGVEFLPLRLTFSYNNPSSSLSGPGGSNSHHRVVYYASYNGGDLPCNDDGDFRRHGSGKKNDDTIELPTCLVPEEALAADEDDSRRELQVAVVQVEPLTAVRDAAELHVEPVTVQDWSLLNAAADWLEGGGLLRQVSVVFPDQVLPLSVERQSQRRDDDAAAVAAVRVLASNFERKERECLWPDDDDDDDESSRKGRVSYYPCLRLVADSRVIIRPKERRGRRGRGVVNSEERKDELLLRVHSPVLEECGNPVVMDELAARLNVVPVSVPAPYAAQVHPDTLSSLSDVVVTKATSSLSHHRLAVVRRVGEDDDEDEQREEQEQHDGGSSSLSSSSWIVVQIQTSVHVPRGRIALHPCDRRTLLRDDDDDDWVASVRMLRQFEVDRGTLRRASDLPEKSKSGGRPSRVLALEPMIWPPVQKKDESPNRYWRHPDVGGGWSSSSSSLSWMRGGANPACGCNERRRFLLKPHVHYESDLPVRVGAIVQFIMTGSEDENDTTTTNTTPRRRYYRVVLDWTNDDDDDEATGLTMPYDDSDDDDDSCLFVRAGDLESLPVLNGTGGKATTAALSSQGSTTTTSSSSSSSQRLLLVADPLRDVSVLPRSLLSSYRPTDVTVKGCRNDALLIGERGSGKTQSSLVLAAVASLRFNSKTAYVDCKKLKEREGSKMKDVLFELTRAFEDCLAAVTKSSSSILLVLDDLDELAPGFGQDEDSENSGSVHQQQQANPAAVDQSKLISDHIRHLIRVVDERCIVQAAAADGVQAKAATAGCGGVASAAAAASFSVVVTCRDVNSLSPSILSCRSAFGRPVRLPNLSESERETLYGALVDRKMSGGGGGYCSCRQWSTTSTGAAAAGGSCRRRTLPPDLGRRTEGFRPRDLEFVASRACQLLRRRRSSEAEDTATTTTTTTTEGTATATVDVVSATETVLESYTPLSHLSAGTEGSMSAPESSPRWADLGGLFRVKDDLESTVMRPRRYRKIYERSKIRLPRGILLFGPPGSGKSFAAPALARECRFPLIACRGPELLDRYVGASESKVRDLFSRAARAAPSVLFLDELDSLAPRRGTDHTGVTDRIVNQLLTLLDGVEDAAAASPDAIVYVVAATSRPDKIDPALLRPGRLEKHVYVGHCETEQEWTDLVLKTSRRYSVTDDARAGFESGRLFREARCPSNDTSSSRRGGGGGVLALTAADVKAAFNTAQVAAVHEAIALGRTGEGDNDEEVDEYAPPVKLRWEHVLEGFRTTRPSLSDREFLRLHGIYAPYRKEEDLRAAAAAAAASDPLSSDQREGGCAGDGDAASGGAHAYYARSARRTGASSSLVTPLRTALR